MDLLSYAPSIGPKRAGNLHLPNELFELNKLTFVNEIRYGDYNTFCFITVVNSMHWSKMKWESNLPNELLQVNKLPFVL